MGPGPAADADQRLPRSARAAVLPPGPNARRGRVRRARARADSLGVVCVWASGGYQDRVVNDVREYAASIGRPLSKDSVYNTFISCVQARRRARSCCAALCGHVREALCGAWPCSHRGPLQGVKGRLAPFGPR